MFYETFRSIIAEAIRSRDTIPKLIEELKQVEGKIAIMPTSRLTGDLLKEIKTNHPELKERIVGVFTRNPKTSSTEKGFEVLPVSDLPKYQDDLAMLLVASNTFNIKEFKQLKEINYQGPLRTTSFFHVSLFDTDSDDDILKKMDEVFAMFADEKSKAVYMVCWLSRLFNDKGLTYLFEPEEARETQEEPLQYRGYTLHKLAQDCKEELLAELYKMKHVAPEPGDVVYDIGGYKGDVTIFFADQIKPSGKVYAFEPITPNYEDLLKHVELNKLGSYVEAHNVGISNSVGTMKAVTSDDGAPWAFMSDERGTHEVNVTTIDTFTKENNVSKVDFIKMDVEGYEYEVISGAAETIKQKKPKLAIAAYHFTSDLINIPLQIKALCPDYKLYMRAKLEGPFGFTFFAKV